MTSPVLACVLPWLPQAPSRRPREPLRGTAARALVMMAINVVANEADVVPGVPAKDDDAATPAAALPSNGGSSSGPADVSGAGPAVFAAEPPAQVLLRAVRPS